MKDCVVNDYSASDHEIQIKGFKYTCTIEIVVVEETLVTLGTQD
jgi:hypothetical protein